MKQRNNLLFEEKVGVRIGDTYWFSSNYGLLLGKIKGYARKIILMFGDSKIIFKKEDIDYIERYRGIFSRGIRISHRKKGIPSFIVLWSFSVENLINRLKASGYKLKQK